MRVPKRMAIALSGLTLAAGAGALSMGVATPASAQTASTAAVANHTVGGDGWWWSDFGWDDGGFGWGWDDCDFDGWWW